MARTKRRSVEQLIAEARLAALRQDPRVIIRHKTTDEPYVPVIQGTPQTDILDLLGRRESESDDEQPI